MDLPLRYGCNPHQTFASLTVPSENALRILNGKPSFINILDALNGWQLVRELRNATGLPAATSFKHVSPAGAAVAGIISKEELGTFDIAEPPASPIANAYLRAREADPKSSFGDFVAVSEPVDLPLATLLRSVVSDGIIAPAFDNDSLSILRQKKGGSYLILQIDPAYEPPALEERTVFGFVLKQDRNSRPITLGDLVESIGRLTDSARLDLVVALCTLKYTQSNSIVCALNGQTVGVGAGQQSRIDCTRIACHKADIWRLRQHPTIRSLRFKSSIKRQDRINWRIRLAEGTLDAAERAELQGALEENIPDGLNESEKRAWLKSFPPVSLASDGYLPFPDNIREAERHGVCFIAHPGGSSRDELVTATCRDLGITLVTTGVRAFHH